MDLKKRALEIAARRAAAVVAESVSIIRQEIVDVMREASPSGHVDEEGYRSSAPGQPPAYGKGVYAASWQEREPEMDGLQVRGSVYSDMVDEQGQSVARRLEWGDDQVAARPHVRIGLDRARSKIQDLIRATSEGRDHR
jgi:hypothetical protein